MFKRVDAHQHFWRYTPDEYSWINEKMQVLRRDFLPAHLAGEITTAGVDASIAVQARQTMEETQWLLKMADEHPYIAGVVGWAPLSSPDFPAQLENLGSHPKLCGLRHVLQDEPDDRYMLRDDFNRGIRLLKDRNLVYDVLIYARHLPITTQFVDLHPNQPFVLDHLAKPNIRAAELSPWREHLRELARRPHVSCKLSGLITEADWQRWTIGDLRPYVEVALEAFGPYRLLAGSDWPVCTVASGYQQWWQTLTTLLSHLSVAEQEAILGGNAIRVYGLKGPNA
ncbi:MAG TPA: amidohydrolase family protein [Alloacidobacterium sp.]|nr:amidohydrolase family protein [Alloacidobacterium sp.]